MSAYHSFFRRTTVAGGVAVIALPLSVIAADPSAVGTQLVKVFPDYYAIGEHRYADLASLEARIRHVNAHVLRLDNCGAASESRLVAAVERFHSAYAGGLEIRPLSESEAGCSKPDASVRDSAYHATDSFGRSMMP